MILKNLISIEIPTLAKKYESVELYRDVRVSNNHVIIEMSPRFSIETFKFVATIEDEYLTKSFSSQDLLDELNDLFQDFLKTSGKPFIESYSYQYLMENLVKAGKTKVTKIILK